MRTLGIGLLQQLDTQVKQFEIMLPVQKLSILGAIAALGHMPCGLGA